MFDNENIQERKRRKKPTRRACHFKVQVDLELLTRFCRIFFFIFINLPNIIFSKKKFLPYIHSLF